ncbi:MAG: COX15/CtaA family protein [Polyangiaceae bacterium]
MSSRQPVSRGVLTWLWLTSALLLTMIGLGGLTRLTGSGLSIVRWEPIIGALPPLNADDWERVFALYRASPQFQWVNSDMTVEGFKGIFWLEYFHRLLGRSIGLVVFLPLLTFWWTKRLPRRRALVLLGIFSLGGLQGLVGWLMVKSGLNDLPQVSHYRLTLHLGLGFLLFALVLWQALDLSFGRHRERAVDPRVSRRATLGLLALLSVTIAMGALVAGLKAGQAFPTFPKMAGYWLPPGLIAVEPLWRNFVDNAVTVHFQHRLLASAVLVYVIVLVVRAWRAGSRIRGPLGLMLSAALVQYGLGIATVLLGVPVWAAAVHQINAALLLASVLNVLHVLLAHRRAKQPRPGGMASTPSLASERTAPTM